MNVPRQDGLPNGYIAEEMLSASGELMPALDRTPYVFRPRRGGVQTHRGFTPRMTAVGIGNLECRCNRPATSSHESGELNMRSFGDDGAVFPQAKPTGRAL